MRYFVLLLLWAIPLSAAESESLSEKERLQRISAEIARRRMLREQELENARKVVREHESGAKTATEAELNAAREVVRKADEKSRQPAVKREPLKPEESASLNLPDADMQTVQTAWRVLFGGSVTIAERAKSRTIRIKLPTMPRDELRAALTAGLREHGIHVIERPDGVIFDTEPEGKTNK